MFTFIKSKRFFEILIPLITWTIITLPIWLSPFHPAVVAYFIILFDVYFLYKSLRTVIMATVSYINISRSMKIDWFKQMKKKPTSKKIKHFIIIPNYEESYLKVKKTLNYITQQNFQLKNIYILLALEKSEGQSAVKRAERLKQYFQAEFGDFLTTYHVLKPNEEKGKASNQTHAAKKISEYVKQKGWSNKQVIVTSCDADALLDKQYLAYLTTAYILDEKRQYHFYSAPVVLYNNYWQLNFIIRMQATVSSILRLAFLSDKNSFIQISTYSMSLWLLEAVNYWDVDIIPEDWHIFLQAFFKFGADVKTQPIYLLNTRDGIRGKNLLDTFKSRYEQEKRWAWGVSDLPYSIEQAIQDKKIPFWDKFFRLFGLFETHYLWPTSFFILTIGAMIPGLINPYFKRTVMGYLLPTITGAILTITVVFILAIAI